MAGHLLDGPLASTTRLDFPHKGPRNLLLGQAQTLVHKALLHNCKRSAYLDARIWPGAVLS